MSSSGLPSPTLVQLLWFELDRLVAAGVAWPAHEPQVWDSEEDNIISLQNEIQKQKAVGAGRGLATALRIMLTPFFASDEDVIALAMQRYVAFRDDTELPATPGFMGTAMLPSSLPSHLRRQ